jgi:pSer/pThr/pTyr-binding forkhead associated (FHA) protein
MAKVILKYKDVQLKEIPVKKKIVTIGRLEDNDITIDSLAVSRHHARIRIEHCTFILEDLESMNGTFLNNKKIDSCELNSGDRIIIGKHELIFVKDLELKLKEPTPVLENQTFVIATKKHRELIKRERDRKVK